MTLRVAVTLLLALLLPLALLAPGGSEHSPRHASDPELPRVCVDTTSAPPNGRTIAVAPGGDVQAALVDHSRGAYRLSRSSQYKHAGSDGKDIGVDLEALSAAMAAVEARELLAGCARKDR